MQAWKDGAQTKEEQDSPVIVHGILGHSEEDKHRSRCHDGDVGDVHQCKIDLIRRQEEDGVPWIWLCLVVDGVVVVRLDWSHVDDVKHKNDDDYGEEWH